MNKFFEMIKTKNCFRYGFFTVLLAVSAVMIIFALFCLNVYSMNYSYSILLSAKELILGSFGVFVINCVSFYILKEINNKFNED